MAKRGRLSDYIAAEKRKTRVPDPPLDGDVLRTIIESMERRVRAEAKHLSAWSWKLFVKDGELCDEPALVGWGVIFRWAEDNYEAERDVVFEHYRTIRARIQAAWNEAHPDVPGSWEGGSFVIRYTENPVIPPKAFGGGGGGSGGGVVIAM